MDSIMNTYLRFLEDIDQVNHLCKLTFQVLEKQHK